MCNVRTSAYVRCGDISNLIPVIDIVSLTNTNKTKIKKNVTEEIGDKQMKIDE